VTGTSQERDQVLAERAGAYRQYVIAEMLHARATAEAVGLNATDFSCLNLIALAGPLTAGQLAQRMGLTTGATTRMIDRLEHGGFARRTRATDRRQVIVELTQDHRTGIEAVLEPARRRMLDVFQSFSADEVRVLFDYFDRAAPAMLAALDELRARPDAG
jgi:DNA-binding MarR family transcriptional regulator